MGCREGFLGRFENPLSLDCVLSQFARELELPEMKYPTLLGPIPRSPSSITWYLRSAAFAIPGTATKSGTVARRHWDADWLPTFVFNTLNRVTVVFAP